LIIVTAKGSLQRLDLILRLTLIVFHWLNPFFLHNAAELAIAAVATHLAIAKQKQCYLMDYFPK
jgi:hypothetical protein